MLSVAGRVVLERPLSGAWALPRTAGQPAGYLTRPNEVSLSSANLGLLQKFNLPPALGSLSRNYWLEA